MENLKQERHPVALEEVPARFAYRAPVAALKGKHPTHLRRRGRMRHSNRAAQRREGVAGLRGKMTVVSLNERHQGNRMTEVSIDACQDKTITGMEGRHLGSRMIETVAGRHHGSRTEDVKDPHPDRAAETLKRDMIEVVHQTQWLRASQTGHPINARWRAWLASHHSILRI